MPLLWLLKTHAPQIILQTLTDSFSLAIRLRVVASAHMQFDLHRFEQLLPQMTGKHPIPVYNNY